MNVTREVILDLLPANLAGEASDDTRRLVEEYIKQHEDFGREIRARMIGNLSDVAPASVPPDLELRALRRTRRVLHGQKWLMATAIFTVVLPLLTVFRTEDGRTTTAFQLVRDYPAAAYVVWLISVGLWVLYFVRWRRLRTTV